MREPDRLESANFSPEQYKELISPEQPRPFMGTVTIKGTMRWITEAINLIFNGDNPFSKS